MAFIKKNKLLFIAIVIEIILLLFTAWDFFLPRFSYDMTGTGIPCNGIYQDGQCHTDEQIGQKGFFTYGPGITLPRGVYTIILDYNCTGTQNSISCMGENTSFNTLEYDDITLDPEQNSVTFTLWANKSVPEFQLTTLYGGEGSFNVSRVLIAETYARSTMDAFYVFLIGCIVNLIIIAVSYYKSHDVSNGTILTILILAGIILFSSSPLFTGYLINGHDLTFHLMRIEGIKDGLLGGQFPVKIQPTQLKGYGYAASIYYGDLFLYIPAVLRIIGFSVQSSYMWFVFLVNVATVLLCFYSLKNIFFSDRLALFGTILYSLSPYRLINIYGRAAVGEYTAMIFFPLLALGLYRIFTENPSTKKYKKNWILPVIAYSGIIESHILSCEIVGIFTIITCLVFLRKIFIKERFFVLMKIVILTILANLGFIVPFIDYMLHKYCLISKDVMTASGIQQNGLSLARLFTFFLNGDGVPQAKAAFRQFGMQGEMGISVGFAALICFFVFMYFMLIKSKKSSRHYQLGIFAWVTAGVTLIMSFDFFPWDFIDDYLGSIVTALQFPWRLFGIGSIALAIVGCCALTFIQDNYDKIHSILFTTIVLSGAVLVSAYMIDDLILDNAPFRAYSQNALPTHLSGSSFNEYAPVGYDYDSLVNGYIASSDELEIKNYNKNYTTITAALKNNSDTQQILQLPLFYFPGYTIEDSSNQLICTNTETDLIKVIVPSGYSGEFKVYFRQRTLWVVSEIISAITIFYILLILLKKKTTR